MLTRYRCFQYARFFVILFILVTIGAAKHVEASAMRLWYDRPGDGFSSALPMGNGRLGAMVLGGVGEDRMILNETSMWSGSKEETDRPEAYRELPEIRKLLLAGEIAKAEALVNRSFTCLGKGTAVACAANAPYGCYQTLGNFWLKDLSGSGQVSDYRRELDLQTGIAKVSYQKDGATWTREYFVSGMDDAIVCRYRCSRAGMISMALRMDRPERFETVALSANELQMAGTLSDGRGGKGVSYAARLKCRNQGGSVREDGKQLVVEKADELIVYLTAATDYRGFAGRQLSDAVSAVKSDMERVSRCPYEELSKRQCEYFSKYMDRVEMRLLSGEGANLPVDRRLAAYAGGANDPGMVELFFHYGRYLLIASNRVGGLPTNLQGIWADGIQTPWNSDWHFNINLQMNYWPVEICDLPELHQPLHRLIASMVEPGTKTAKSYYGSRGWIAHVVTNPWGFTSPGEAADWGASVSGSAWLCHHLWEHYEFTQDKVFLKKYYPVLKGCCQFYLDNLFEDPKSGCLVTGPSSSPENRFLLEDGTVAHVCMAPTIDMQLLRQLFGNTAQAAKILAVDEDLQQELRTKSGRLVPNRIGADGRIMEWMEAYAEPDPHHNHTSPLYGLFPSNEITPRGTPELAAASAKLLVARGENAACWPYAWRANLWARLGDKERALGALNHVLRPSRGNQSGVSSNLFSYSPFQIDANMGACAAIVEMMIQSHAGEIEFLPALPKEWGEGKMNGVRTRGGYRVKMEWSGGELKHAKLWHGQGGEVKVRYRDRVKSVKVKAGKWVDVVF